MYRPTIKEFAVLFKNIFTEVILKYPIVTVSAAISSVLAFISTYYTTQIASASTVLLDKTSTLKFETRLMELARVTLIAVSLKYIPMCFFTYLLQQISREKFIENLKEYMDLRYTEFHKKTPGEIRFTVFLKSLSYPICAQIVIFDLVSIIGTTMFTFIKAYNDINPYAACVFPLFPLMYGCATFVFLKYRVIYNTVNLEEQQKTSARIYDKLANYDVIKSCNLEEQEITAFRDSLKTQAKCQLKSDIFFAKGKYIIRFITILPYILLGLLSFITPNAMNGATLFQAVLLFSSLSGQIKKMGIQLARLASLLNQIRFDTIKNGHAGTNEARTNKRTFERSIEFRNVCIYHGTKCILEGVNVMIGKGEVVAIVGSNGTGKSTFIKSILGFSSYTGEILVDGVELRTLTNKSIFSLISYVPQDDFTSDDTILNNLKLGCRNATRKQIEGKAKLFKAHEAFEELENGYETEAGIRGNRLSGGQKQKISIVRAAIKDSPIFILDETTAAIDKGYEKIVMEIFLEKMREKTVLMIIHQKDYLKRFDKIVFLGNGRVEACGAYEDLVNESEEFRKFVCAA